MPPGRKCAPAKATKEAPQLPLQDEVKAALVSLESKSTQRDRENLARFAISTSKSFGVSKANLKVLARDLGRDHELAAALWDTGWYEARMLGSGDTIPNSGRVADARPGMERPRQCDSGLGEGEPLSNWALAELVGQNRVFLGFIGIKNRLSSDIGREFRGDACELGRESTQRRSENNDSSCS